MENKQIVDGVDVSKCIFYQANFEEDFDVKIKHFCSNWHNSCESVNNGNCYFKQLARKTQECEELKNKNKELIAQCFDLAYKVKKVEKTSLNYQLAEQLDQLKAENETYKKMLDNPEVQVALIDIRTGERDLWQKYKPRMEQAEQKLKRIKDILQNEHPFIDCSCGYDILQIIYEEE